MREDIESGGALAGGPRTQADQGPTSRHIGT